MTRDKPDLPATISGLGAVLLWGIALPFYRISSEWFGEVPAAIAIFAGGGLFGIAGNRLRGVRVQRAVWRNPGLYLRWAMFSAHESLLVSAIFLIRREHLPLVIFLNYLWPTAVILCSVLFAGVRIARWPTFVAGNVIVVGALAAELLGPGGITFLDGHELSIYLMAAAGALCWELYSAISRRIGTTTGGGAPVPLFQITVAVILAVAFAHHGPAISSTERWWYLLLGVYCVASSLAYMGWDLGMRQGGVVLLSLAADFIPFMSLFAAHLFMDVTVTGRTFLATAALVAGAMLVRFSTRFR